MSDLCLYVLGFFFGPPPWVSSAASLASLHPPDQKSETAPFNVVTFKNNFTCMFIFQLIWYKYVSCMFRVEKVTFYTHIDASLARATITP